MTRVLFRAVAIAAAICAGWAALGTFFVSQDLSLVALQNPDPLVLRQVAIFGAISTVIWVILTPFVLFLAQTPTRRHWLRTIARLVAIVLGFAIVRSALGIIFVPLIEQRPIVAADAGRALQSQFHSSATLLGLVVIARFLYDSARILRERERRAITTRRM